MLFFFYKKELNFQLLILIFILENLCMSYQIVNELRVKCEKRVCLFEAILVEARE